MWLIILGMGVITYLLRFGSLQLASRWTLSSFQQTVLRFVPVAVLSAIVAIELFVPGGQLQVSPLSNPRIIAAALAIGVCLKTRKILPTIAVGMVSLWILQAIL